MGSYTMIETMLALAVLLLASYELAALLRSRREGRTRNRSRVITLSFILSMTVTYVLVSWLEPGTDGEGPISPFGMPTVPWRYLVIGGMMALVAAFEAAAMCSARARGLTRNTSRLVSYSVMFVVLLAMLSLAVTKWEHYLDRLDQTIASEGALPAGR